MGGRRSRPAKAIATLALAAAVAVLAGCTFVPKVNDGATLPKFTVPTAPAGGMPLGFTSAPEGAMKSVTDDGNGFLAAGWSVAGATNRPRIWATTASGSWRAEDLPAPGGKLEGVARNGDVRVAVGASWDASGTAPLGALAFVQRGTSAWTQVKIDNPPEGVLRLEDVVPVAGADGTGGGFAAGGCLWINSDSGELVKTPVVYLSADGTQWQRAEMTLPSDVAWVEGFEVASSGPKTAWPGLLAAASGTVQDDELGTRYVAKVLSSGDGGASWTVVSDDSFEEASRNMEALQVRANVDRIVVGGAATDKGGDPADPETAIVSIMWGAGPNGNWNITSTSGSQNDGRTSAVTSIAARRDEGLLGAGFLIATEAYDTGEDYQTVGGQPSGDSALQLLLTPNGVDFANITEQIPGSDKIAVVKGIAQGPDRIAMVGAQKDGTCGAWIVDSAIKY